MSLNDQNIGISDKKQTFFLRIKNSFKIGKKSTAEKIISTEQSKTSQRTNLKYVNLMPTHKVQKNHSYGSSSDYPRSRSISENGEVPTLIDVEGASGSSCAKNSDEKNHHDVDSDKIAKIMPEGDNKHMSDDEEEQLRLYKAMHDIRKQMILKEKQFQEEKLQYYKLQLEADNLLGHQLSD